MTNVCPDCLGVIPKPLAENCLSCGYVRHDEGWLPDPLTGLILAGRYRLEGRLGAGGMASVFRATRVGALGGHVAVKVLAPRFARTVVAKRFEREAQVVSQLSNPHIVRIYDFDTFTIDGIKQPLFFIAMELIKGATLTEVLLKQGKVNFLWGIDVLRQSARGLDEAHQAGITHRDLKPSNMMVVQHREATHIKIVDFGIAALNQFEGAEVEKLTQTGLVSGTPDYMAPEQAVGGPNLGPPADIYSLGVIAYEMFSGVRPFYGETAMDTLMQRVTKPAPPLRDVVDSPDFPPELLRIVDRMLLREPGARYADAGQLLDALKGFPTLQTSPDFVPPAELVARYANVAGEKPPTPTKTGKKKKKSKTPPGGRGVSNAQLADTMLGSPVASATETSSAIAAPSERPAQSSAKWLLILAALVVLGVGGYFLYGALTAPETPSAPATTAFSTGKLAAQTFRSDGWTWELSTPTTPGALHTPLPIRVQLTRDGEEAGFSRATLTMRLDGSGDAVGTVTGERLGDGSLGFLVPARPMAAVFALELRGELADGTTVNKRFRMDAETNSLTLDQR